MTTKEKVVIFDKIQIELWDRARRGDPLQSTVAASLIRRFEVPGPDGEDPDDA